MKKWLHRLWNTEAGTRPAAATVRAVALAVVFAYPVTELLLLPPAAEFATLTEVHSTPVSHPALPWIWAALVSIVIGFRVLMQLWGTFIYYRPEHQAQMLRHFRIYMPSVILSLLFKILLAVMVAAIFWLAGKNFSEGLQFLAIAEHSLRGWLHTHVPPLLDVQNKWLALFLAWTTGGLVGYIIHWLTHISRFLWHVVHAPHHAPEFLHPIANPVAYTFDIFLFIPSALMYAALTSLFHSEPLVIETGILTLCMYMFEIFNHSTVHYEFAYRNPVVRFCSNLFGGQGVYHYTHHSAALEHQKANLGGGIFQIWDRVFGTFARPPEQRPAVGFTHQPELHYNPLRVWLAGPAKLWYEWTHNRGLKEKFLILFGSVHYHPPVTKEFLKKK